MFRNQWFVALVISMCINIGALAQDSAGTKDNEALRWTQGTHRVFDRNDPSTGFTVNLNIRVEEANGMKRASEAIPG